MHGQISALWVFKKWMFETFLETTKAIGFIMLSAYVARIYVACMLSYNALGVFCKFDVCTIHADFVLCGPWKSPFSKVVQDSSNRRKTVRKS